MSIQPNRSHLAVVSAEETKSLAECDVSIVFPCLNEAEAVGVCVRQACEQLRRLKLRGEVIVCDNGSDDGSPEIARRAGARVVHEARRGYGAALAKGIAAARGRFLVMVDADGSYELSAIGPMIEELENGADLVVGNRFAGQMAPGSMPWSHRYIGNPALSALLNIFFGTRIGDTHCGMRAFTRAAYDRILPTTGGMEFASEMIARAAHLSLEMAEVPVDYHPRIGASKLRRYRDGWRHLKFLLLYSPSWVFSIPSTLLGTLGFALLFALAISPITFMNRQWDMHLSAVASLLAVLSVQLACLGISTHAFSLSRDAAMKNQLHFVRHRFLSLEFGLLCAIVLSGMGGLILGWIIIRWISTGLPALNEIRLVLLAVTLLIVGVQIGFNAVFIGLLRLGVSSFRHSSLSSVD